MASQQVRVLEQTELHPAATREEQQDAAVVAVLRAWEGASRPEDGEAVPDPWAVAHACRWVTALIEEARQHGDIWLQPHVVASPTGEIVFEWQHGTKLLTIYLTARSAESLQARGTDMDAEMREGDAGSAEARRQLWSRLTSR